GAGSIASILQDEYMQNCRIVGVEFDQVIIKLAHQYFSLDRFKDIELIHYDALEYVKKSDLKFDLIAIDLFINDYTQDIYATKEFIEYLKPLLNEGGLIVYNRMVSSVETENQATAIAIYFMEVFGVGQLIKYDNGGGHNWFVVNRKDT
ncbi:MAG: methyltransferase domain-containing protein, partial [Bacteroidetes bacterium]|nr:methyltransferase domain-containing protein [Bacteroidota bacterium]